MSESTAAPQATAATHTRPLLEVRGLSVAYGAIEAIRDVNFSVQAGQIVSLIGAMVGLLLG